MSADNARFDEPDISTITSVARDSGKASCKEVLADQHEGRPTAQRERWLLVRGALGLSVLGIAAFLATGQVAVVLAMNAPLLAIIGKEFFTK